ncbi:unnamed protein product [Parnassius apollo]|uniref:RING-type E3 ubiquitin transferase n=1 Tax=Parnassius apollo TaxID=110799 RepID=A0A8S3WF03_PARAO|nr:unnamed protein product [Parnassius apollo]
MADALVERRPTARFFCHRCNIEFEDVLQDYTCPYCASGFIEQLENEAEGHGLSGDDFSDADMSNLEDMSNIDEMSNLDDSDDLNQSTPPMLNDLAFFMSGGRLRGPARRQTLMEELVWMIGGVRPGTGAVTAGAPFVFVGAPGDYVFGGEGLDAVVTQLLGQLENAGPPPLPRDQLASLPSESVSADQAAANTSCSVCWENFLEGESISRLECEHVFHSACIRPWLQLHATCPICRRSLLPDAPAADAAPLPDTPPHFIEDSPPSSPTRNMNLASLPRVLLRRIPRSQVSGPQTQTWDSLADSSSSSGSTTTTSSVTAGGVWAPQARSTSNSTGTNSTTSLNSSNERELRERQYNMDIDYD